MDLSRRIFQINDFGTLFQEIGRVFERAGYYNIIYLCLGIIPFLWLANKPKEEEIYFNWFAFLTTFVALIAWFCLNRITYGAFLKGFVDIFFLPAMLIVGVLNSIRTTFTPPAGFGFTALILTLIGIVFALFLLVFFIVIAIPLFIYILIVGGISQICASPISIPVFTLLCYPSTSFITELIVASLTRHPLEGVVTVSVSRKVWLLIIGSLFVVTGVIGKILQ